MTRSISRLLFFLTLVFNSTLFGQGRVDSDSILHNIWWTTYKIDNDTNLVCTVNSKTNQSGLKKVLAYYSKENSIYKIVELTTIPSGTQMTSFYLADNKPIFISVTKNNYHFSEDKTQFFKAVNSFSGVVDTNYIQQKQLYKDFYQAKYFLYQDMVRYANVLTGNTIRVNNKNDNDEGLRLYRGWKSHLVTKQ